MLSSQISWRQHLKWRLDLGSLCGSCWVPQGLRASPLIRTSDMLRETGAYSLKCIHTFFFLLQALITILFPYKKHTVTLCLLQEQERHCGTVSLLVVQISVSQHTCENLCYYFLGVTVKKCFSSWILGVLVAFSVCSCYFPQTHRN